MHKVAIVILNWNGKELLDRFLPKLVLETNTPQARIVVAENASTDDSVAYIERRFPDIEIIKLSENYGFAEGYNRALAQLEEEYFVLLNSDVEVSVDWLKPLLSYMEANKDVVAVQPKILSQRDKRYFEYAGAAGGYIDHLGFPFCRGRIFDSVEQDNGQYNSVKDIFWASGACMMVRSKDFIEDGGFDSKFFAHMEEIDLCWRFRARGKRIVCIPQSVVFHVGGATLKEDNPRKIYLNFRNNMLMLYKNLPEEDLKSVIKKRIQYNRLAILKFLLAGEWAKAKAVRNAHKDFKKMISEYQDIRTENLLKTTETDIPEIYEGNITLEYYLKGKKRFISLSNI